MEASDDWVQYVIDRPMAQEPGKIFNYSSGVSELLAYIFEKETGKDIEQYGGDFLLRRWASIISGKDAARNG